MSMTAYTGLPGHGKSYGVVQNVIIPACEAGRHIVSNIPLNVEELTRRYPQCSIQQLPDGVKAADIPALCPDGSLIVLDECWRWWPAGLTASKVPAHENEFFTQHRHKVGENGRSNEIVLVTQDLSQIAMFIRALIEQTFRVVKLTAIGSKNRFRVDVYEGAVTGSKPPEARRIRQMYGKYDPNVYALYQSHTQSQTGEAGNEDKSDDRGNVLKGWRIKLAIAAIPLALVLFIVAGSSVMKFKDGVTKKKPGELQAPVELKQGQPLQPQNNESKTWRLTGRVIINEVVYFIVDSQGGTRRVPLKSCDRDDDLINWRCHIDGEIVAAWTGPPPPVFNEYFTASAAPQSP